MGLVLASLAKEGLINNYSLLRSVRARKLIGELVAWTNCGRITNYEKYSTWRVVMLINLAPISALKVCIRF